MNVSDDLLIQCIQSDDEAKRNWALHRFYSSEVIRNWMAKQEVSNNALSGYMEDIFQEALIVFDRNIRLHKFEGKSSLSTYLLSIMKWMIANHLRKNRAITEFNAEMVSETEVGADMGMISEERKNALHTALQQIDARCRELLTHYKLDFSMKEIAEALGFSSPEMAKKQAYRCREKLRTVLLSNPSFMQILKD